MADLTLGSRGPEVVELHRLLNRRLSLHPPLPLTDRFGPGTREAIVRLQSRVGILPPDGRVQFDTWEALRDDDSWEALSDDPTASAPGTSAGMDRMYYPGDHAMQWIIANTDLR